MTMKRLLRCLDVFEAHHCANVLRAAGITAEVRNTLLSGAVGDIPFIEAGPEVWVDERQDAEQARAVIKAATQAPALPPWQCPACGEELEGQFAQCWHCGAVRPSEPI